MNLLAAIILNQRPEEPFPSDELNPWQNNLTASIIVWAEKILGELGWRIQGHRTPRHQYEPPLLPD